VLIGILTALAHAVLATGAFWMAARWLHDEHPVRIFAPPASRPQAIARTFFSFDNGIRSDSWR
jgi:hypothetical protein